MKKLRVLLLTHPQLIPPEHREDLTPQEFMAVKTEFDVVTTLKAMGHELLVLGVQYELRPIRDAVDAFHYHRHVDHAKEGGLRFGLWSNKPGTISEPDQKRPIWHLLKAVDTPGWKAAAEPYLKTCGLKSWDELNLR